MVDHRGMRDLPILHGFAGSKPNHDNMLFIHLRLNLPEGRFLQMLYAQWVVNTSVASQALLNYTMIHKVHIKGLKNWCTYGGKTTAGIQHVRCGPAPIATRSHCFTHQNVTSKDIFGHDISCSQNLRDPQHREPPVWTRASPTINPKLKHSESV